MPATTVVAPVFVVMRSALVCTVAFDVALLFALFGSDAALNVAMFEIVEANGADGEAWSTSVNEAFVPVSIDGVVHVIVPVPPTAGVVHDQPGDTSDTNVVFAGVESVSVTVEESDGPAFATPIVYVMSLPAMIVAGPLLLAERSLCTTVFVLSVEELLAVFGSYVPLAVMVAVFESTMPPAVPGGTATVNVKFAIALTASSGMSQTTVPFVPCAGPTQLKAGPLFCTIDTNVVPAGRGSESVTLSAGFAPPFVALIEYV